VERAIKTFAWYGLEPKQPRALGNCFPLRFIVERSRAETAAFDPWEWERGDPSRPRTSTAVLYWRAGLESGTRGYFFHFCCGELRRDLELEQTRRSAAVPRVVNRSRSVRSPPAPRLEKRVVRPSR